MRFQPILITSFLVAVFACNNARTQNEQVSTTPKALQDKDASGEVIYKRRDGDLVERLYNELIEKTPALKEFESNLENIAKNRIDSTALFNNYNNKSESYYNSADRHLEQINDSALRKKMELLISSSLTKYNSSISEHTSLLKAINSKSVRLNDLHVILKNNQNIALN